MYYITCTYKKFQQKDQTRSSSKKTYIYIQCAINIYIYMYISITCIYIYIYISNIYIYTHSTYMCKTYRYGQLPFQWVDHQTVTGLDISRRTSEERIETKNGEKMPWQPFRCGTGLVNHRKTIGKP